MIHYNITCPVCGAQKFKSYKKNYLKCEYCDSIISNENTSNSKSIGDIYIENLSSIVEISTITKDGEEVCGTGIIMSKDGLILTCYHIFEDIDPNSSILIQNLKYNISGFANIVRYDEAKDLALLKMDNVHFHNCMKFSNTKYRITDKIYVIGNSKGEGLYVIDGIISDVDKVIDNVEYIVISAPVTNGYSGAPVISNNGSLIGMVIAGRNNAISMNYALPLNTLLKFLKTN